MNTLSESALRGRLHRLGYQLVKSRSRTPEHYHYGQFMIRDPFRNMPVIGYTPMAFSLTLEDVADFVEDAQSD